MSNNTKKWTNNFGNINIVADITAADIPALIAEENIHSLQLYTFENPQTSTWETLNEFYKKYPHIGLRVSWYEKQDLAFFKTLPNLRKFTISSYLTTDFTALQCNTKLTQLGIQDTKSKAVDLSFIHVFKNLTSLYVDGMKKGLENVAQLKQLKSLTFRGIKMNDVDMLIALNNLEDLNLAYGSYKNLAAIGQLTQLKSLAISRVRQVADFDFLQSLHKLERLEFEGMSSMEKMPALSYLAKLNSIHIHNNASLQDLATVAEIPYLKLLHLTFPENFKSASRKRLLAQAVAILMQSKTIKYTNIIPWLDDETSQQLTENGIKKWTYGMNIH